MPRIVTTLEFAAQTKDRVWQMMTRIYEQLARVINGGISFGIAPAVGLPAQGNRQFTDNIDCVWIEVTIPTANADFILVHNLGRQLSAYIIARKGNAVDMYDSPTNATIPPGQPAGQSQTWLQLYGNQRYIVRVTAPATMVLLLF